MSEQSTTTALDSRLRSRWDAAAMRLEIADLFDVKPWIYWIDFTACVAIGWTTFVLALTLPISNLLYWVGVVVSVLALYRAISFTHELVHLRNAAVPGFRIGWSLLCGIPLLVPNFLYSGVHIAHHSRSKYGTLLDGEYMPFATSGRHLIVGALLSTLVAPLLGLVRFALLAPVSYLHPTLHRWVKENASAMSLRIPFRREVSTSRQEGRRWRIEEWSTCAFLWLILVCLLAGWLPREVLIQYGVFALLIAALNAIRAIGATHRHRSAGTEMSLESQFRDSVTVHSSRLDSLLLCPVRLRYHALHHAFPTLPYHALKEGHRRLLRALPADADYRQTVVASVWKGWRQLLAEIRQCAV